MQTPRHHDDIQPRFLAFMVARGEVEFSEKRAKAIVEQSSGSAEFFAFISEMKQRAADLGKGGVVLNRSIGSAYTQIVDHAAFTEFLLDQAEWDRDAAQAAA